MDSKILKGALLAYREVYNQNLNEEVQEVVDEGKLPLDKERRDRIGRQIGRRTYSSSPKKYDQMDKMSGALKAAQKKEEVDVYDIILSHLLDEGYASSADAAKKIMVNMSEEWRESIISGEQLQELSNRKLRAYVKKSEKSHQDLNKKWDQGTASYKDKYKSINRERGQERAFKTLDKRSGK